jgi:hypothetical protein
MEYNKHDPNLEERFRLLANERIVKRKYIVFDKDSRLIKRHKFEGLNSESDSGLVILNSQGAAVVLTEEFERELLRVFKIRYEK